MKRLFVVLLVLAAALMLLAAALLLLDFRAASSNTQLNSQMSTAKLESVPVPQNMRVYVWIEEKDRLSTQLRDALLEELRATGRFDPLILASPKPGLLDYPLLRVWIERPGMSWTPVYAQADMKVRWGFSTFNTEIDFEQDPPRMDLQSTPDNSFIMMAYGNVQARDRTIGLVSLPAYWNHLARQGAQKIAAELADKLR